MKPDVADHVEKIVRGILDAMGASYDDVTHESIAGQAIFTIRTADGASLIGMHGDTVHAIDFLAKKILEKEMAVAQEAPADAEAAENETEMHFLVDVNEYRSKQIKDLQMKALMMADRARSLQYDVELSPMSAYERLIVHTTLQDAPNVKTESQGEGRNRRVVIKYAAD